MLSSSIKEGESLSHIQLELSYIMPPEIEIHQREIEIEMKEAIEMESTNDDTCQLCQRAITSRGKFQTICKSCSIKEGLEPIEMEVPHGNEETHNSGLQAIQEPERDRETDGQRDSTGPEAELQRPADIRRRQRRRRDRQTTLN